MKNVLTFDFNDQQLTLSEWDIHLWLLYCDEISEPELLQYYHRLLNPEERQKQQRFYFERHRKQYLLTRALVRTSLSRYEHIAPESWTFTTNDYGRPEISASLVRKLEHDLRFNLSHTDGLIACAISNGCIIGVDVENTGRQNRVSDIADRFFSEQECLDLRALPERSQHERFFDYWTLKESYIKARGMGLALPLGQFSFHLHQDKPIRISFGEQINDDPARWSFHQVAPSKSHKLALCAARRADPVDNGSMSQRLNILIRKVVPLIDERVITLG